VTENLYDLYMILGLIIAIYNCACVKLKEKKEDHI